MTAAKTIDVGKFVRVEVSPLSQAHRDAREIHFTLEFDSDGFINQVKRLTPDEFLAWINSP